MRKLVRSSRSQLSRSGSPGAGQRMTAERRPGKIPLSLLQELDASEAALR